MPGSSQPEEYLQDCIGRVGLRVEMSWRLLAPSCEAQISGLTSVHIRAVLEKRATKARPHDCNNDLHSPKKESRVDRAACMLARM